MAGSADMARSFAYEAQTQLGQIFRGTLEAVSASDAQARLSALQLRVVSVEAEGEVRPRRGRGLSSDDFLAFNQELAYLTKAGLPVERGLRLIAMDLRSGRLARATEAVAKDLEAGVPMPEAFKRHSDRFPALYGNLMEAGAATGNLPGMLFNLGKHLELMGRLRRDLWRTISYPIVVFAAMSVVLLFISIFVLPRFGDMYSDFRTDLPTLTKWFLAFGRVYPTIFCVGVGLVVAGMLASVLMELAGVSKSFWYMLLLRMPLIGPGLKANLLARWLDAIRLGVEGGMDLPKAMRFATDATGVSGLRREATSLLEILSKGEPLRGFHGRWIPGTIPAAIDLASAGGDLPGTLQTLTRMHEQQADFRLRAAPTIVTPVLMVVVGGGVVLCIMSLFLPLVRLVQSVSGGS